ncbi:MAG: class I SAM-dependent methyltransferase [Reichenbachiella sp.]
MSNQSTKSFYDELSVDYHLIFRDWNETVIEQGKILDQLIQRNAKIESKTVLDCSCGIGTQAIGLALNNYVVTGTDLSPKAIERARTEAKRRDININFNIADFTKLESQVNGKFDVVLSCDNSLPHLLTNETLLLAAKNIFSKMKLGGLFIGSIRDYDLIIEEKITNTTPNIKGSEKDRTITFQVWDWYEDNTYLVNHFTIKGMGNTYETHVRTSKYKAYKRCQITEIFTQAGFKEIKWLMPDESDYYQPIFIAYT